MDEDAGVDIEWLREMVGAERFSVRSHVVRHMLEEGFERQHCVESIMTGRVIEHYPDVSRCLIVGWFEFTPGVRSPLHVVCDYSDRRCIDLVTAYIPQRPWWVSPQRRGGKR